MRDAKFRALTDIQTGPNEFVEGFVYGGIYIHDEICKYITTKDFDFISAKKGSIGQYTGLKDKNGVEIYEGDVCINESGRIAKVIWFEAGACFDFIALNDAGNSHGYYAQMSKYELAVIGNIHQNPELLEK